MSCFLNLVLQGLLGLLLLLGVGIVCSFLKIVYIHGRASLFPVNLKKRYGSWAVVTGCTEGIGLAYTVELAKRGLNIVLISRNIKKLNDVAATIEKYGVETKIVVADFSSPPSMYEDLRKKIEETDVGILVNNAGIGPENLTPFDQLEDDDIWKFTSINCLALAHMTKFALTQMLKKGRGAIVNVSSTSALCPIPDFHIYSASKAFVRFFTKSLQLKYESQGVFIQNLTPSFVSTRMVAYSDQLSRPGLFNPTPETFVAHAIRTVGISNDTAGYWPHEIQAQLNNFVPERISSIISLHLFSSLKTNKDK